MPPGQPDRAPGAAAPHGSHPGRGIQPAAGAGQGGAATGREASGPLGERGPGPPGRELLAHHQPAPGPSGLRPAPHDGFAAFPGTGRRPAHRALLRPGPPGCWPRRWTTPFWPRPSWPALAARAGHTSRPAVVCRSPRGLEPFPGVYSVRLLPALQDFLQADRRPTRFLEVCRPQVLSETEVLALDPEGRSFFNLNTPGDLNRAENWLAGTGSLRDSSGRVG